MTGRVTLFALAVIGATPLSAQTALPGVSDQETTIASAIRDYHFGKGDVMFVRDRTNRWYRLALNKGCLRGAINGARGVSFEPDAGGRIDRSSRVFFKNPSFTCLIDSIRRSAPPPQVDSKSPTTLS